MTKTKQQFRRFKNRFKGIFKHPFFWMLTIIGNSIMLFGSALLMVFESSSQASELGFVDFLLWSAGLVTTIGYGDYMAVSLIGKFIVLGMMLLGTLFIWSYMAFLVAGLFAPELAALERDFRDVEKEIREQKIGV